VGTQKTIVVTGGAGYVGSVVATHLLLAGHCVVVVDSLAGGGEAMLGFLRHPRFQPIAVDIRDRGALDRALTGADAVVHLAALVGEPACAPNEADARAINIDGTEAVLASSDACRIGRLIYVSTCSNYGVSDPAALADEDAVLNPLGVYARTKVAAERRVLGHAGPTLTSVLRFGTICGVSSRMRFDLLVNEMARAAVLGERISIFAPTAWRPYLHIRDAARAVEWSLEAPAPIVGGRVFNVVGENRQKRDLVDVVRRHFPPAAIEVADTVPDARDYRVSASRVRELGGFSTAHTVEEAFLDVADAVRSGVFQKPRWRGYAAAPAAIQGRH
jgi:nucleoside-diphosphate-sugar epimerase